MAKATQQKNIAVRIDDMTSLQAQATFNEYEQKIFKELSEIVRKHNKETLIWYWDLGVRLTGVQEDAKKNKEHYGNNVLGRLSAAFGFKTAGPFYQALGVVEAFSTKKAFTEFTKLAGEAGNVLTWGHIVMLSGISDPALRLELAGTALEQGWTVDVLRQQVAKLVDRKQRGIRKPKPKVKIPASVKKCIQHVSAQAAAFVNSVKNSWTGDAFDIKARVDDIPAGNLTEALLAEFAAARQQVLDMIASAEEMDSELEEAAKVVRRKLAAQAQADADAEAAAAEEAAAAAVEEEDDDIIAQADDDDEEEQPETDIEVEYEEDDSESLEDLAKEDPDEALEFVAAEIEAPAVAAVSADVQHSAAIRAKRLAERAREYATKARAR